MSRNSFQLSIGQRTDGRVFINLYFLGKRFRYSNGLCIGEELHPNKAVNPNERVRLVKILKAKIYLAIEDGWLPNGVEYNADTFGGILEKMACDRLERPYSYHYHRDIRCLLAKWHRFPNQKALAQVPLSELSSVDIIPFIAWYTKSITGQKNLKSLLSSLLYPSLMTVSNESIFKEIKLAKPSQSMHKPFSDVKSILNEIFEFDHRLHLCCILAYGCLLRPHREIRMLTWGDFSQDFTQINLSGSMNKGKRNRVVPIPPYIRPFLGALRGDSSSTQHNIFTGSLKPYNRDFFKTLWGRYKKVSSQLERDQTIYSFRHSGALEVYRTTGSIHKLQQVMGHGSLHVSLTYLRGLPINSIEIQDLPQLR